MLRKPIAILFDEERNWSKYFSDPVKDNNIQHQVQNSQSIRRLYQYTSFPALSQLTLLSVEEIAPGLPAEQQSIAPAFKVIFDKGYLESDTDTGVSSQYSLEKRDPKLKHLTQVEGKFKTLRKYNDLESLNVTGLTKVHKNLKNFIVVLERSISKAMEEIAELPPQDIPTYEEAIETDDFFNLRLEQMLELARNLKAFIGQALVKLIELRELLDNYNTPTPTNRLGTFDNQERQRIVGDILIKASGIFYLIGQEHQKHVRNMNEYMTKANTPSDEAESDSESGSESESAESEIDQSDSEESTDQESNSDDENEMRFEYIQVMLEIQQDINQFRQEIELISMARNILRESMISSGEAETIEDENKQDHQSHAGEPMDQIVQEPSNPDDDLANSESFECVSLSFCKFWKDRILEKLDQDFDKILRNGYKPDPEILFEIKNESEFEDIYEIDHQLNEISADQGQDQDSKEPLIFENEAQILGQLDQDFEKILKNGYKSNLENFIKINESEFEGSYEIDHQLYEISAGQDSKEPLTFEDEVKILDQLDQDFDKILKIEYKFDPETFIETNGDSEFEDIYVIDHQLYEIPLGQDQDSKEPITFEDEVQILDQLDQDFYQILKNEYKSDPEIFIETNDESEFEHSYDIDLQLYEISVGQDKSQVVKESTISENGEDGPNELFEMCSNCISENLHETLSREFEDINEIDYQLYEISVAQDQDQDSKEPLILGQLDQDFDKILKNEYKSNLEKFIEINESEFEDNYEIDHQLYEISLGQDQGQDVKEPSISENENVEEDPNERFEMCSNFTPENLHETLSQEIFSSQFEEFVDGSDVPINLEKIDEVDEIDGFGEGNSISKDSTSSKLAICFDIDQNQNFEEITLCRSSGKILRTLTYTLIPSREPSNEVTLSESHHIINNSSCSSGDFSFVENWLINCDSGGEKIAENNSRIGDPPILKQELSTFEKIFGVSPPIGYNKNQNDDQIEAFIPNPKIKEKVPVTQKITQKSTEIFRQESQNVQGSVAEGSVAEGSVAGGSIAGVSSVNVSGNQSKRGLFPVQDKYPSLIPKSPIKMNNDDKNLPGQNQRSTSFNPPIFQQNFKRSRSCYVQRNSQLDASFPSTPRSPKPKSISRKPKLDSSSRPSTCPNANSTKNSAKIGPKPGQKPLGYTPRSTISKISNSKPSGASSRNATKIRLNPGKKSLASSPSASRPTSRPISRLPSTIPRTTENTEQNPGQKLLSASRPISSPTSTSAIPTTTGTTEQNLKSFSASIPTSRPTSTFKMSNSGPENTEQNLGQKSPSASISTSRPISRLPSTIPRTTEQNFEQKSKTSMPFSSASRPTSTFKMPNSGPENTENTEQNLGQKSPSASRPISRLPITIPRTIENTEQNPGQKLLSASNPTSRPTSRPPSAIPRYATKIGQSPGEKSKTSAPFPSGSSSKMSSSRLPRTTGIPGQNPEQKSWAYVPSPSAAASRPTSRPSNASPRNAGNPEQKSWAYVPSPSAAASSPSNASPRNAGNPEQKSWAYVPSPSAASSPSNASQRNTEIPGQNPAIQRPSPRPNAPTSSIPIPISTPKKSTSRPSTAGGVGSKNGANFGQKSVKKY